MVPAWSLLLASLAGLAVGAGACLALTRRRATPAAPLPEPVPLEAEEPAAEAHPVTTEASDEKIESLGAGVEDVVAELERRYRGRKAGGDSDQPAGTGQRPG